MDSSVAETGSAAPKFIRSGVDCGAAQSWRELLSVCLTTDLASDVAAAKQEHKLETPAPPIQRVDAELTASRRRPPSSISVTPRTLQVFSVHVPDA